MMSVFHGRNGTEVVRLINWPHNREKMGKHVFRRFGLRFLLYHCSNRRPMNFALPRWLDKMQARGGDPNTAG
jgi:hypothetical protein